MPGPWEKYQSGPWEKYGATKGGDLKRQNPAEYDPASPEYQARYGAEQPGFGVVAAGRAARMGAQGLAAIPLAISDAGVGVRNLLYGNMRIPSEDVPSNQFNRALDQLIPPPSDMVGRVGEAIGGGVVGGRFLPNPPSSVSYQPPVNQAAQVLQRSRAEGYVVPPATSNPTATNKVLEGIAGKLTTAQAASAKNQAVTTTLAKRAIGLSDDAPLTSESIAAVRKEAAQAYEAIRGTGRITADKQFQAEIGNLTSKYRSAAKDFPELAKSEVDDIVSGLNKESFDADSAVDLIAILRGNADDAFRAGKSQAGRAYRDASKALEGVIERHLAAGGKESSAMLAAFRKARELIAKTYSVEKAFNPATGQVSGPKLAQQLSKKPLSGELKQAAEFAKAFPKAAREFNESLPGISPLDFYASGGVSALSREPWYLLYPFLRQGTRNALLSQAGQKLAVPAAPSTPNPLVAGGLANALLIGKQGF